MEDNKKNGVKTVWIYAIILFTSAFIVLLFTAYSQIKLNSNLNDYKNQISSQKKEKINFITDLNTTQIENNKLKTNIASLKEQIAKLRKERDSIVEKLKAAESKYTSVTTTYDSLLQAEKEYDNGNFVACAEILSKKYKLEQLGTSGRERFSNLIGKSYGKAAQKLYFEGYSEYVKSNYNNAISNFQRSFKLLQHEYYSDDCLYFIAYSQLKLGKNTLAKQSFSLLIKKYPESSYINDVDRMLKSIR